MKKVVLAGGTGFVGRELLAALIEKGYSVVLLTRSKPSGPDIYHHCKTVLWDGVSTGEWDREISGAFAVINLCGENIATQRWTEQRKEQLLQSRVGSTSILVRAMHEALHRPSVFINASAIGYYGFAGDTTLTETSRKGDGFLADLCDKWETAARGAEPIGIRVVTLRIGVVFEKDGGAIARTLPMFNAFLGGQLGAGKQWISWIHRSDLVSIILAVMTDEQCSGALNAVAPAPIRNKEFSALMGKVLGRPNWLPVPAFALKAMLGEMSSIVLESQRVLPKRLEEGGFEFKFKDVEAALRDVLK